MDRSFTYSAIVFTALAVVGVAMATLASGADVAALREIGPALLAGGLAAFLVEAFSWDRGRSRR